MKEVTREEVKSRYYVLNLKTELISESEQSIYEVPEEYKKSQLLLEVYNTEELKRVEILNMKNSLETTMYEMKAISNEDSETIDFLTEEEVVKWRQVTVDLEEMLFMSQPKESEMKDKIKQIKKLRKEYTHRYVQWNDRDDLVTELLKRLNDMQNQIAKIQQTNKEIPDSEIAIAQQKINSSREWIVEANNKVKEQPRNEDPKVYKRQMIDRAKEMTQVVTKLRNYKPPKKEVKDDIDISDMEKDETIKKMKEKLNNDLKMNTDGLGMTEEQIKEMLEKMNMEQPGKRKKAKKDDGNTEGTEPVEETETVEETEPVEEIQEDEGSTEEVEEQGTDQDQTAQQQAEIESGLDL